MRVTLISYTPDALNLLLFTRETRLTMTPEMMEKVSEWNDGKKMDQLTHMLNTIRSSWEFVDYVFLIEDVTRAFTHQLVRTRHGSYAQQTQRAVDMSDFTYLTPPSLDGDNEHVYHRVMDEINLGYSWLRARDVPAQDARGLLPTNTLTNITAKFNLRTLSEMASLRLCTRTQGEYQDVFREMRRLVLDIHPWAERFLRVYCAATGTCQFPDYAECPIKGSVYNPDTGKRWDEAEMLIYSDQDPVPMQPMTRDEIQVLWENTRFEAVVQLERRRSS